jgi:hypothetical protein
MARLSNLWLGLRALPALLFDPGQRQLLREMRDFCRRLPATLSAPLPQVLADLTPQSADLSFPADTVRVLADFAALLDRRSPLGVCLRRSLTRYHYLRRAGLPVAVQFGARFSSGKPDREIAGHAWLTLDGQPYFEYTENYRGFTVMYAYPQV